MGTGTQKRNIVIARICVDLILFCAVLFAHWLAIFAIGLIGLFVFRRYIEIIAAGITADVLYGGALVISFIPYPLVYTAIALLLFLVSVYPKQFIRFYDT